MVVIGRRLCLLPAAFFFRWGTSGSGVVSRHDRGLGREAPTRQLGNGQLFRQHARANIQYLDAMPDATIITCCPHCFTTLKYDYRPIGADINVLHHSQQLAALLSAGRLSPSKSRPLKTAYHDPCFLGRYNGEYDASRQLLRAVG